MQVRLGQLLERARSGDREAREEIFSFLRARFLVLAKLRLVSEDAEDIVQETLIVVDRRFLELLDVGALLGFTDGVMRNKIGNFYTVRNTRRKHTSTAWDPPDRPYLIEDELGAAELERVVRQAVDRLGQKRPLCRTVLLSLCDGMSTGELTGFLRLPRARIDDIVFRCRKALRKILIDEFGWRI